MLEFLKRFETEIDGFAAERSRMFITGSGGNGMAKFLGAKFVQEVNAVSLAVEKLYPECGSVIELGGQDAKIIIFKTDPETGRKKKIPSMNDKCAGGTGAVIDKINAKLRIPAEQLCEMGYQGIKLHPVAGKCGVFAETDINGLQKMGVPPDELMASLFEAIVMQNLSVLTRGNTLLPVVLLLGRPELLHQGHARLLEGQHPEDLGRAQHAAARGRSARRPDQDSGQRAVLRGASARSSSARPKTTTSGSTSGYEKLEWYVNVGREEEKAKRGGGVGLAKDDDELAAFKEKYRTKKFTPATFQPGEVVEGFIGIDGGSTSTKAVLLSKEQSGGSSRRRISSRRAIRSRTRSRCCKSSTRQIRDQGATLKILGVGTTGYAKDILKDVIGADAALVETVAHTEAGAALLRRRRRDLRRRRAGHQDHHPEERPRQGFQAQHAVFGGQRLLPAIHRAGLQRAGGGVCRHGLRREGIPVFGYGCAVFMQSDIVDFQRQGWKPEEIMAGLCNVLPKNIWLYVSQIPNLSAIGTKFLLQGGTQYNLAAVKAQVDFIESRFKGKDMPADVIVHEHCGEAGAIGAALEAGRLWDNGRTDHVHRPRRRARTSSTRPRATKPPAATSARTSACARSSTSRPAS